MTLERRVARLERRSRVLTVLDASVEGPSLYLRDGEGTTRVGVAARFPPGG